MPNLFTTYTLKNHTVKNRIVFPPVVCFQYAGSDGMATDRNVAHYTARAEGGPVIKTHIKIPVITVNEIKTPERASWLLEHNMADFVALARPQMADPSWANHVKNNEPVNLCLSCKPKCRWYEESNLCPAVIKLASEEIAK